MTPNTIYRGDSCKLLAGWPAGSVDLVFADPPYNIGYKYDRYEDDKPDHEFEDWCRSWIGQCARLLADHGSLYLAIGDDFAAQLRLIGRDLGLTLRNWIIWHYTFGQNMRTKFSRAHTHILYFVKNPARHTFNDRLLRFPSARHTEYQDLRANPLGRLPDDVWDEFPRVCGTFKERDGYHGCQLPEALLTRIILASSNLNDVVLDPFVGSGTTAAVAKRLGRRYVGIDLSPTYVKRTQKRLEGVRVELGPDANPPRDEDGWSALELDTLAQLYRETKVVYSNLIENSVALGVIAAALGERVGRPIEAEDVRAKLTALWNSLQLPKLPNDRPFSPRKHASDSGKRYVRRVSRWQARRTSADGDGAKGNKRARGAAAARASAEPPADQRPADRRAS